MYIKLFLNFSSTWNSIWQRQEGSALTLLVFRTKQGTWHKQIQMMKGYGFPSTRTTNLVRLIFGSQYSIGNPTLSQVQLTRIWSINFDFWNTIFQPMVFPFVGKFMTDHCKLSFPHPLFVHAFMCSYAARFTCPNKRACSQAVQETPIELRKVSPE